MQGLFFGMASLPVTLFVNIIDKLRQCGLPNRACSTEGATRYGIGAKPQRWFKSCTSDSGITPPITSMAAATLPKIYDLRHISIKLADFLSP